MTLPAGYTLRDVVAADADVGAWAAGRYPGTVAEVSTVAEGRGKVVAGAGLVLLDWGPTRGHPEPLRGRLVNVWTHPEHRRLGLARTLGLLARAQARGIGTIGLGSTPPARALYLSLGFVPQSAEMKWEAPQ